MPEADLIRLRSEYASRKNRLAGSDIYSVFNKANLFATQQRERVVLHELRSQGFSDLAGRVILEMGCGGGGVLLEFTRYGVLPTNLYGVDLLPDRLRGAHHRLPVSPLANADGQYLPFLKQSFDLVIQYTALSSILDDRIRRNIATDMLRVVKPDGAILWYDFWLNPTNRQTKGIRPAEIRSLFPGCTYKFHKITLAPPIARRVVPVSWIFAQFLENLKIFNSHYLAIIRPK